MLTFFSPAFRAVPPSSPPLLLSPKTASSDRHSNTSYLDGLRGLAALAVVIQHFALPFQPSLLGELNHDPFWSLFQLPIIRLSYSGSFAVGIFFAISGIALSIKPLTLLRDGEVYQSFDVVSSSAFRRGIRIFLPPIVIVVIMMVGERFQLFDNNYPLAFNQVYDLAGPIYQPTLWAQLCDATNFVLTQIIYPDDWLLPLPKTSTGFYGFQLWTISTEFWASQLLFITIIALLRCRRLVRNTVVIGLISYSMWCGRWDISLFLGGMILADLKVDKIRSKEGIFREDASSKQILNHATTILICIFGLYIGSVPDLKVESTPGLQWLSWPKHYERFWQSSGALLVLWAINRSELLQWIFETRAVQYLGQISFALYLVHVPIISSFGWDFVPMMWSYITGKDSMVRYELGVLLSFLLLLPILITCADIFWRLVDRPSIELARYVEKRVLIRYQM